MKPITRCLVTLAIAAAIILAPVAATPNWIYAVLLVVLAGGMYFLFARLRRFKLFLLLLLPVLFVGLEGALRIKGYHRTVKYERRGDLLFAPKPSQRALAKISFKPSTINAAGFRDERPDAKVGDGPIVLCVGDSITFGYGIGDEETYPAQLQALLASTDGGDDAYAVLNGGVNAHPMGLIRERYREAKKSGIDPEIVIVGFSLNEGLLGDVVADDRPETKDAFERRVLLKNFVRSFAIYNLVLESWGRYFYEKHRARFLPGTNRPGEPDSSPADDLERYRETLGGFFQELVDDGVRVIALAFAAHNRDTGTYDTKSDLQTIFKETAREIGIPMIVADELFAKTVTAEEIESLYIDRAHLSRRGNEIIAEAVAEMLATPR